MSGAKSIVRSSGEIHRPGYLDGYPAVVVLHWMYEQHRGGQGAMAKKSSDEWSEEFSLRLNMRVTPAFYKAIDAWRRKQDDLPSRAVAIRRLIELGMTVKAKAKN
jgi:hypothetical protein